MNNISDNMTETAGRTAASWGARELGFPDRSRWVREVEKTFEDNNI